LRGIGSVRPTPFHQTGSTAPADLLDLIYRVAFSIEPNSLIANACGRIFTYSVGS
jgi:hypothetical protein